MNSPKAMAAFDACPLVYLGFDWLPLDLVDAPATL